jgi:hypothetical protein
MKARELHYCQREGCKTQVMADTDYCARHRHLRRTKKGQRPKKYKGTVWR